MGTNSRDQLRSTRSAWPLGHLSSATRKTRSDRCSCVCTPLNSARSTTDNTNAVHSPSHPQFSHPFHQNKPGSKSASASADYSDESEEEEDEEDDSDEEDGGQSLSDMLGANNAASAAASAASSSTASSDALPSHQKLLDFVSGLTSTSRDGRRGATGDGRSGGGGATRAAEETEAGTESEVRLLNTSFTRLRATRLSNLSLATASICSALALLCFGSLMVELCFAHAPLAHSWPCVACPCSTCPCCLLFAHDTHVPSGLRPPLPLFSLSSLTLTLLPLPHTNSPRSQFTATGSGASLSVEALAASLMNPGGAGGDAMNPELHSTLQRLSRTSGKLSAPAGRPMQERMTRKVRMMRRRRRWGGGSRW